MRILLDGLAWIGRYGTQGFAASIFLGLALPQFAAAARPLLAFYIFGFVTITFARVDRVALRDLLSRLRRLVLASLWLIAAPASLMMVVLTRIGRQHLDPGLVLGLALFGAAPPIMSAPAIAMLLNLPPILIMAAVLVTTRLAPLTSPLLAELIAGAAVPLDRAVLIGRLLLLIGGAILGAAILRLWLGAARLRARKAELDGLGVVF